MFWSLPGPDRYLESVVSSLFDGKHVIMILPEPIRRNRPFNSVSMKIRDAGLGVVTERFLSSPDQDPVDALAEILDCPPDRGGSLSELLDWNAPPSRFIAIDLGEMRDRHSISEWNSLLKQAGEHAQIKMSTPYQLLVTFSAEAKLPPEDLMLSHHPWWGVLGSAEVDWVAEHALIDFPPSSTAEHYWLRSLCRGLCGYDLDLVRVLVEEKPTGLNETIELLQEVHAGRCDSICLPNFEPEQLVPHGRKIPPPPRTDVECSLWHLGYLDWSNGKGPYLHSAFLAAKNYEEEIRRRIWLAQLELLLPLVERIRLSVLTWLVSIQGPRWIEQLTDNLSQGEREDIETEIGSLAHHIFRSGSLLKHRDFLTVKNMIWLWRDIRNDLAHGKFVSLARLDEAWLAYDDFVKRCT